MLHDGEAYLGEHRQVGWAVEMTPVHRCALILRVVLGEILRAQAKESTASRLQDAMDVMKNSVMPGAGDVNDGIERTHSMCGGWGKPEGGEVLAGEECGGDKLRRQEELGEGEIDADDAIPGGKVLREGYACAASRVNDDGTLRQESVKLANQR